MNEKNNHFVKMCDLKYCKSSTLDEVESDIVEVKTVWPKRRVKTSEFHINWAANGEARFHEHCWTQIISSIKRNIRSAFKFSSQEKTLLKEAKKTAEFRNAHKKIIEEAKHVSDLIKSSEHCVAFTGMLIHVKYSRNILPRCPTRSKIFYVYCHWTMELG